MQLGNPSTSSVEKDRVAAAIDALPRLLGVGLALEIALVLIVLEIVREWHIF